MARKGPVTDDPYSEFVLRIVNSCRIADRKSGQMSDDEHTIVKEVLATLVRLDPHIDPATTPRINPVLRPYDKHPYQPQPEEEDNE